MKEIDVRGLACPAPVLQTKAVIEEDRPVDVKVVVDNEAAGENVSRFLTSRGYDTCVKQNGNDLLVIGKSETSDEPQAIKTSEVKPDQKKIMIMVATDCLGFGDDQLGKKLMVSFINTLKEMGPDLWRLILVNNGVKLAVQGSEVLPVLQEYENEGLHILVCGTCLTHFNLLDQKQVGETTNMLDIVTGMQLADQVINI